jgi:hypothetical protein
MSAETVEKRLEMVYKQQRSKSQFWQDEAGISIPYNRVNKVERLHERLAAKIAKEAIATNKKLAALNELLKEYSQQAYDAYLNSEGIDPANRKGNFIWHNFDGSIKIEVNVNEPIVFDSLIITAAKHKLDEFLDVQLASKNEFVKAMVIEAFETSRGKMDTKKVLGLTKHEERVNAPLFSEAVALINKAIRRPKSKTYRRVWLKDSEGQYQAVELNLSSL